MAVGRNISHVRASGVQATDTVGQSGAVAEYSRIGPSYETTVNFNWCNVFHIHAYIHTHIAYMYSPNSHKLTIASSNNMTLYFQCNIRECLLIVAVENYTQINKHVYAG